MASANVGGARKAMTPNAKEFRPAQPQLIPGTQYPQHQQQQQQQWQHPHHQRQHNHHHHHQQQAYHPHHPSQVFVPPPPMYNMHSTQHNGGNGGLIPPPPPHIVGPVTPQPHLQQQQHHHQHQQQQQYSPELEDAILHQVEFYFSLENLRKDKFLMKKMKNGTVPFDFVCGFPRLKKLTVDRQLIAHVVSKSKVVTLSQHGRRIGRRDHHGGAADLGFRLVEITNLPMDSSLESVTKLVEHFGTVVSIDFGWEGEHEATAAGNTPAHQHHQAFVEFKEAKAAVQCVDKLSSGSNWRGGYRTAFLNGLSSAQVAKQLGLRMDHPEAGGSANGNSSSNSTNDSHTSRATTAASGSSASSPASSSAVEATLPPVIPEGDHTGAITELNKEKTQGVIRREGKRRCSISFQVPADLTGALTVGDRVDFTIKHVNNKAVVTTVAKSTANASSINANGSSSASSSSSSSRITAHGGGAGIDGKSAGGNSTSSSFHRPNAKGPDGGNSIGFKLPRTKPGEDLLDVLQALKSKLHVAVAAGAAAPKATEGKGSNGANGKKAT